MPHTILHPGCLAFLVLYSEVKLKSSGVPHQKCYTWLRWLQTVICVWTKKLHGAGSPLRRCSCSVGQEIHHPSWDPGPYMWKHKSIPEPHIQFLQHVFHPVHDWLQESMYVFGICMTFNGTDSCAILNVVKGTFNQDGHESQVFSLFSNTWNAIKEPRIFLNLPGPFSVILGLCRRLSVLVWGSVTEVNSVCVCVCDSKPWGTSLDGTTLCVRLTNPNNTTIG